MKIPKRTPWQWTNEHCLKDNGELRATINEQCTRWKRKNRIAQLKHTIKRLTFGDHLPNSLQIAYRGMSFMQEPSSDAPLSEHLRFAWECQSLARYFSRLAESSLSIALQMRDRKEQDNG